MRPLKNTCEIAVIGGGLAGLSAARHAVRLGRLVTLFEGSGIFGGQVSTVGHVEGLPFPGAFSGQDLAMHLLDEVRKAGVQVVESCVEQVETGERLTLKNQDKNVYHPQAIIVASGASLAMLGVPGEEEFLGRGVSHCASCDGNFFRGEDVVVVGGGDGAVHEAMELVKTSRRVFMVCRSPLRAKREYIDRLAAKENVSFIWNSEVTRIVGNESVERVQLRNVKDGNELEISCSAVFPFIGVVPDSGFLPAFLRTATGHVDVKGDFTSVEPRIFVVGAARTGFGGTLVQAMAEGERAAWAANSFF